MKRLTILALGALSCGSATAQPTFSEVQRTVMAQQTAQVRINVGMNMFVPAPSGIDDKALAAQEKARRQIYALAMKECSVLTETIAAECKVEGVNVNVNRQHGNQQIDGFTINANMNYRVTLK
jgi:hypothetical protein